jgi:hypothetical protein
MLSCRDSEALALPALNPDFLYAALYATAYAAFVKESRKKRAGATKLHRKSGEARDQSPDSFPRINAGAPTTNFILWSGRFSRGHLSPAVHSLRNRVL